MKIKKGAKVVNVCRAIEEMREESEEKGLEKGTLDTLLTNIKTLMKNMKMTAEHAMDILEVNEDDRLALMKML